MDENKNILMLRGLQWDHCRIGTSRALLGAIVLPVSFLLTSGSWFSLRCSQRWV